MATQQFDQGTKSSSILNLGTLASATYVAGSAIDLGDGTIPWDVTFELECDPNGSPTGNKQLILFLKISYDNTNWSSGPESGTTATEEGDLYFVGAMPCNDTNTHRKTFTIFGLPRARYIKIVVKNDMGVALTSGNVYRTDIANTIA